MKKILPTIIIFATIIWSFSKVLPPVLSDTTDPTAFSINNALFHLKNISKSQHDPTTESHKSVQKYLVNELHKLGLTTEIQTATAFNKKWIAGVTVQNIIARIKGTTNKKSLLLLSHYDSNPHSAIGASDDGSGIVTILESVRAFLAKKQTPKNDIIILFSDAEELGLLGAKAFVKHHPLAKNVGLVLNLEARGSGGSSYMLMETNGKNSKMLSEFINAKPNYPVANSLMYSVYKMLPNDTDLTIFREKANINGFNFAFIGDHFDYHTAQDNYNRLDRESLTHQADYLTTCLNYFANSDLSNLNSNEDFVYVNFPFIQLLTYPFSWVLPMLIIASLLFLILVFIGIKKEKINIESAFKGFIPFVVSLVICVAGSYGLWQLILLVHPQYNDILQGFTYNGYQYITAFVFLNLWVLFKVYNYFKAEKAINLLVAPITFWLLINLLISQKLQGAGFFIIPVFIALSLLAILIFIHLKKENISILFTLLSIPTLYIFAPLVKMFPVGLGLKNIFIASLFIVLVFGLLVPIFYQQNKKNRWQTVFGLLTILGFGVATFNSGFSIDKKKPNSLIYIQNENDNTAYFATYNKTLDSYTKQIFDTDFNKGDIKWAMTKSKYNSHITYHKKTTNRNVKPFVFSVSLDTIVNNDRLISFTIKPQRKVSKYELYNNNAIDIKEFCANGSFVNEGIPFKAKKETLLTYTMATVDNELNITLKVAKNDRPIITISEVSNDLLTHSNFNIKPRSESMMPMPFITNDAIICTKKITF